MVRKPNGNNGMSRGLSVKNKEIKRERRPTNRRGLRRRIGCTGEIGAHKPPLRPKERSVEVWEHRIREGR